MRKDRTHWEDLPFEVGEREVVCKVGSDGGALILGTRYGRFSMNRPRSKEWRAMPFGVDFVVVKKPYILPTSNPQIHTFKYEIQG